MQHIHALDKYTLVNNEMMHVDEHEFHLMNLHLLGLELLTSYGLLTT